MSDVPVTRDFFVEPGYVCVPAKPAKLAVVVSSGVAVALFDRKKKKGGLGHYIEPYRRHGLSTAMFAAPAIVSLVNMFLDHGCSKEDIEAHIFGGAENSDSSRHNDRVGNENIAVGLEILKKMNIRISTQDTGGTMGRKIVFHTGTGETVVAKVEKIRESDWYPQIMS
ncbi:MAG: chemotaxis protein CheD [Planctomycetota bacterium]|jgi:chemotaxis protein CheD